MQIFTLHGEPVHMGDTLKLHISPDLSIPVKIGGILRGKHLFVSLTVYLLGAKNEKIETGILFDERMLFVFGGRSFEIYEELKGYGDMKYVYC